MLRRAEERDLEQMRVSRNQRANREVSIHDHVISAEEHAAWWDRVCADPSREVLVYESGGRPLGVVSFFDIDRSGERRTASWGFFLDHETVTAEGLALTAGMQVMKEALDHAFGAPPEGLGLDELHGEVLAENQSVRAMNRRLRFREGEAEQRRVGERTLTVHPLSLRREDRRRPKEKQR